MVPLRIAFLCSISATAGLGLLGGAPAAAQQPGYKLALTAPEAQLMFRLAAEEADRQEHSAWIGVRMTPIPAPLAAHIGDDGLMIGNIAIDSPADKAGLQQYDVITRFNTTPISGMESLLGAVAESQIGKAARIEIIRNGESKTIEIMPENRPSGRWEMKFKYEEPAADLHSMDMRGKRLRRGPGGTWMMEDLGPMNMPDLFHGFGQGPFGSGGSFNFGLVPPGMPPLPQGHAFRFFMDNMDADDESSTLSFSMTQDGQTLSVQRDDKGRYTVESTDEQGNKQRAEYDSAEEFRNNDPDNYQTFRQATARNRMFLGVTPPRQQIPGLRQDFQEQLQKMIDESRRQAEEAQRMLDRSRRADQAERDQQAQPDDRRERRPRRERRERMPEPPQQQRAEGSQRVQDETLSVKIADGRITVREARDGKVNTHRFDSEAQLKEQNPDLYERIKPLLTD